MDARLIRRVFIIVFCIDVSIGRPVNVGLVQECLEEMKLGDKTIDQLSPVQLGELKGKVDAKYDQEKALNNKISVVFYFRVRIDWLEAILVQDEDVKKELKRLDAMKFTVTVPEEVEPDGKSSFKGRYRVWFAIGNVMANDEKNDGFMVKARKIFKEAGVDTKDPKLFAGDTAMLFNKLSSEVKKDSADEVDWKCEEEVIAALKSWRKLQDEDQINIARAIYRLFR